MKGIAASWWIATIACGIAGGCAAQGSIAQPNSEPVLNQAIPVGMTCGQFRELLKAGDKRTSGTAILWLDGYYSGHSGVSELPAGWLRTVGQGVGGTCAISVNEGRTVLDVIGQLHREYATQK